MHKRRVVDAVNDEEQFRRVCANVDLAQRRESPVQRLYCDRGGDGWGDRKYIFPEKREKRRYVRRGVPAY
jgi:hypothetical protein